MTEYKISLIPGDGIGPELSEATLKVLEATEKKFGLKFNIIEAPAGDCAGRDPRPEHGRAAFRECSAAQPPTGGLRPRRAGLHHREHPPGLQRAGAVRGRRGGGGRMLP